MSQSDEHSMVARELICKWCKHMTAVHRGNPQGTKCSVEGCDCTCCEPDATPGLYFAIVTSSY
jgi:hypothetical protein